jgi:hypothetical protein
VGGYLLAIKRGFYTLANDASLDWFVAMCESLRRHEPELPLLVIPWDGRVERLERLAGRYQFSILEDDRLEDLDEMGRRLWQSRPERAPMFRKFAAFWGPLDEFMYIDTDIVVLHELAVYFDTLARDGAALLFMHSDHDQVYAPGEFRERMIGEHGSRGFNAGIFVSRRGVLDFAGVQRALGEALPSAGEFDQQTVDQGFLNFCMDLDRRPLVDAERSVREIGAAWAGMRLVRQDGGYRLADWRTPATGLPVSLIHWSGYRLTPLLPYRRAFLDARLGERRSARDTAGYLLQWTWRFVSSPRELLLFLRVLPSRARNWLSARRPPR